MAMSLWVNDKRSGRLWAIDVDIMAVMAVVAVGDVPLAVERA
jgi:hypothetical protein